MDNEKNNNDSPVQQITDEVNTTTENLKEHAEHICGQVKHAVCEVCGKTANAATETYEHAKSYTNDNPGKAVFIALGIGVGLGLLLGAKSHHSRLRSGRYAQPVIGALSDIALEFFR